MSFYSYVARQAVEAGVEQGVKLLAKKGVLKAGEYAGRTALYVGKKVAGAAMPWLGYSEAPDGYGTSMGSTARSARNFIGPWDRLRAPRRKGDNRVALLRDARGKPVYLRRGYGSGATRAPSRILRRSFQRATPNFLLGRGGAAGLDVASVYLSRARPRRRPLSRRLTPSLRRQLRGVKRFSSKKRTYRRRR